MKILAFGFLLADSDGPNDKRPDIIAQKQIVIPLSVNTVIIVALVVLACIGIAVLT